MGLLWVFCSCATISKDICATVARKDWEIYDFATDAQIKGVNGENFIGHKKDDKQIRNPEKCDHTGWGVLASMITNGGFFSPKTKSLLPK